MSEIVDMMLEGIICQYCGGFIDGCAPGYPRSCGCNGEDTEDFDDFKEEFSFVGFSPIDRPQDNNKHTKKKKKHKNKKKYKKKIIKK